MGKSRMKKLEDRVGWLGKLAVGALAVVAVLGLVMIVERGGDAKIAVRPGITVDFDSGAVVKPEPTPAPVADALAIASLKDYAGLEAERMAKMAAVLLGLGGLYDAECSAAYWPHKNDKVAITYTITWQRGKQGDIDGPQAITWYGASWQECIKRMLAWKQGGE